MLLGGVNDSLEDARAARAARCAASRTKVNLIPYNANPGLPFAAPAPDARRSRSRRRSLARNLTAVVRKNRGRDISAACGQLAAEGGPGRSRARRAAALTAPARRRANRARVAPGDAAGGKVAAWRCSPSARSPSTPSRRPSAAREDVLGGSASYFSTCASFFGPTRVVAVVGRGLPRGARPVPRVARRRPRRPRAPAGAHLPLEGALRVRPQHRPHARHPAQRVRRVPARAAARTTATPSTCSSATSTRISSARCSTRCAGRGSSRCDTMNFWIASKRREPARDAAARGPAVRERRRGAPARGASTTS